jgi:ZIP family zinc transporter
VFYVVLGSFLLFHVTERYVLIHDVSDVARQAPTPRTKHFHTHAVGGLGASGLVVHSVLDGVAIGAAFQANSRVGAVVALAVIAHDSTRKY